MQTDTAGNIFLTRCDEVYAVYLVVDFIVQFCCLHIPPHNFVLYNLAVFFILLKQ